MDDLLKAALAGTSRLNRPLELPPSAIGRAMAQLDGQNAERIVLLVAGANAIRSRAGGQPLDHPESTNIAEAETWDVAPERVALLIGELLRGQVSNLLPEALARLQAAQLLIPPALLPVAIDAGVRNSSIRPLLMPVIGQRGRWLARQNPGWSWAAVPSDDELMANAETIWQDGKQADRLSALRLIRERDPESARAMLESTWQHDRATFRAEAIDILGDRLSHADLSFLEDALSDRSQAVRERADALLVRIPGSPTAKEAIARAEPLLAKRFGIQVVIRPPENDDASSDAAQAAELIETIGRVPPSHWVSQLGKQPADLVKSVAKDREWGFSVIAGWTQAALTFGDADWAAAIWPFWLTVSTADLGVLEKSSDAKHFATVNHQLIALLQVMRPHDAEQAVARGLFDRLNAGRFAPVLGALPRPWSAEFAALCLQSICERAETALTVPEVKWHTFGGWIATMQLVTLATPAVSIQRAIATLNRLIDTDRADDSDEHWKHWIRTLQSHIDTLHLRQRIYEEIPG